MFISNRRSYEELVVGGSIIGLESALSYYDLCNFADQYMVIITGEIGSSGFNSRYFKSIPRSIFVEDSIVDYEPSNGRLKITTPESSICEMILYDRRDDFIIQALQNYVIFKEKDCYDKEKLFSKAKDYGVYEKMQEYLVWAYEDLDDMC